MLLRFQVSGFRSFIYPAELDLLSRALKTVVPRKGQSWIDCTERVAAIYGPNASGKTTILDAMHAVAYSIVNDGSGEIFQPHQAVDKANAVTAYSIDFVGPDGVRYLYEIEARTWGIARESLHSFPRSSKRTLFVRQQSAQGEAIQFSKGASLTGPTVEVLKLTKAHMLYLAVARKYGHVSLSPIADALALGSSVEQVSFRDAEDIDVIRRVIGEMLAAPGEQGKLVQALLKVADLGLEEIDIQSEAIPEEVVQKFARVAEVLSSKQLSEIEAEIPRIRDKIVFIHSGEGGSRFELPLRAQSSGTLTWLTIAWHTLNALKRGSILLVDELDASLHPELARYIVSLFTSDHLNPHGAQLVFSTHDVSLLGNAPTRILYPRNIWFVQKDDSGYSELYSLDDFDDRPRNNSEKRYLAGRFGAVPQLDDFLLYDFITTPSFRKLGREGQVDDDGK
ncbi:AAA family ATPase [Schaalia cardiffensis]|uniref:AAA family ATPase n=1 Tax=Schaalia cardiffensis TaxID=181487 RepID=UPI0023F3396B|nr:ATP-binding protein [Schaalia cardiffensis]